MQRGPVGILLDLLMNRRVQVVERLDRLYVIHGQLLDVFKVLLDPDLRRKLDVIQVHARLVVVPLLPLKLPRLLTRLLASPFVPPYDLTHFRRGAGR